MKLGTILATGIVALLMGCASPTVTQSRPSEDLLVACPKLEQLPFENMGDAVNTVLAYIGKYNECAKRHNALVEYERKRQ